MCKNIFFCVLARARLALCCPQLISKTCNSCYKTLVSIISDICYYSPAMGNNHPHTTPLASGINSRDMKMLEEQTNLEQEEIMEQYMKFKGATSGEEGMSREVFSKIMKNCYPRTYKVGQGDH